MHPIRGQRCQPGWLLQWAKVSPGCLEHSESGRSAAMRGMITNKTQPPTFQVRVNDTNPIFFYCSAPGSCYQQHMIGVINPSANETLDMQMQYAMNATYQMSPGDPFPSETANPTASHSPASDSNSNQDSGGTHLSTGAIVGIAIGGTAFLILAGVVIYLCGRRGAMESNWRKSSQSFPPPMGDVKFMPKSPGPGQEQFANNHYSMAPSQHIYGGQSPSQQFLQSPPPMSPNVHPTYGGFPNQAQGVVHTSPHLGVSPEGAPGYL